MNGPPPGVGLGMALLLDIIALASEILAAIYLVAEIIDQLARAYRELAKLEIA